MSCQVLGLGGGWFGSLAAPWQEMACLAGRVPGLVLEMRQVAKVLPDGRAVQADRLCLVLENPSRDKVLRLNMALSKVGAVQRADEERSRRREHLSHAWEEMQQRKEWARQDAVGAYEVTSDGN